MQSKSLLIKNGSLVSSSRILKSDIFISNGKITQIDHQLNVDADKIIDVLNSKKIKGVKFSKTFFSPRSIKGKSVSPKYKDEYCNGIKISILNKEIINPLKITVLLLDAIKKEHPNEFKITSPAFFDKLYGSSKLRSCFESNNDVNILIKSWVNSRYDKFLLY